MVTVAEILKNNGLAVEKSESCFSLFSLVTFSFQSLNLSNLLAEIMTSTVDVKDDARNRPIQKAKVSDLQMTNTEPLLFRMYSHHCFSLPA